MVEVEQVTVGINPTSIIYITKQIPPGLSKQLEKNTDADDL